MKRKITTEYSQAVFNLPWLVADEEGLFADEGLEVEFVWGIDRERGLPPETDPTRVDPFWRHAPFEERTAQFFNACEWGQIRRSEASSVGGRIVWMRPAVVSQGIFVRPDSPISHPQGLRDRAVAVNFHAGSHYLTLQMLEGFMERAEINVVHLGQARLRYEAMLEGSVDAAALMEPYIALAEKTGCKLIVEAHYAGSEIAPPDVDRPTFEAINRAVRKAVQLINADKMKYLHHLLADVPPELGSLSPQDFRLSRLRYVEPQPYPPGEFEKTHAWMVSWGLAPADAAFETLVDNRIGVPS
ncbi:MAG TPA: ABC transporter substrate-binding protein [Chloroflexota bacterium]|nr:ABC transporter substrate-binding protein [Chloroflexota bacterium]